MNTLHTRDLPQGLSFQSLYRVQCASGGGWALTFDRADGGDALSVVLEDDNTEHGHAAALEEFLGWARGKMAEAP